MKKYSLDSDVIASIVDIIAEKLEVTHLGLEEREVLTEVVALSVALYLNKLCPTEPGMIQ